MPKHLISKVRNRKYKDILPILPDNILLKTGEKVSTNKYIQDKTNELIELGLKVYPHKDVKSLH